MTSDNPRKPDGNLPDWRQNDTKPLDEQQRDLHRFDCNEMGMEDCEYAFEALDLEAVKDAMRSHYIDAHPGHKIADANVLMDAERYRS